MPNHICSVKIVKEGEVKTQEEIFGMKWIRYLSNFQLNFWILARFSTIFLLKKPSRIFLWRKTRERGEIFIKTFGD